MAAKLTWPSVDTISGKNGTKYAQVLLLGLLPKYITYKIIPNFVEGIQTAQQERFGKTIMRKY